MVIRPKIGNLLTPQRSSCFFPGLFLALLLILGAGMADPAMAVGRQPLQGHRSHTMSIAPLLGRHDSASPVRLAINLPIRNASGLEDLNADLRPRQPPV